MQKYSAYVLIVLTGSIYILLTEGWDRWSNVFRDWASLGEKSTKVMTSEEAATKKIKLHSELASLRSSLARSSQGFEQSEAGLVELVGELAKREAIRIEALTPTKQEGGGGVAFTIELLGSFHKFVGFLNNLENSPLALKLERLEIDRNTGRTLHVKMTLEATFVKMSKQK